MILILSKAKGDVETEDVMQWIECCGSNTVRFNGDNLINLPFFSSINTNEIISSNFPLNVEQITTVWYRRYLSKELEKELSIDDKITYHVITQHLYSEFRKCYDSLLLKLEKARTVSSLSKEKLINKVHVLSLARNCGLEVPNTIITNDKRYLIEFLLANGECVVKPLSECILFSENEYLFKMFTEKINHKNIKTIPDFFHPSLFQQYIPKLYELRVFYWFGECYSMAIFSQDNDKTTIDYRNYDNEKPNRNVPYQLPKKIEKRINNLMKMLELETGSIDLIKTNDKYIFLEVNPNGQFGMVSYPCNYYLEEIIANKLISLDNNEE